MLDEFFEQLIKNEYLNKIEEVEEETNIATTFKGNTDVSEASFDFM